jgi:hypothetical protein
LLEPLKAEELENLVELGRYDTIDDIFGRMEFRELRIQCKIFYK